VEITQFLLRQNAVENAKVLKSTEPLAISFEIVAGGDPFQVRAWGNRGFIRGLCDSIPP
jgi:hypothetical protein